MLALRSGADTSLIGGTGRADRIIASVGKDLRLETLQDASTYDAKQQSIGVKANICVYGYCKSSVSGHVAQGRMNSDFRSASEQAGLKAGDGGFQLDIARNTTLVGAAISSSERAALEGRNALGTRTLDVQDVKNTARYKADQIALSGGYSWGGDGGGAPKKGDAGKADVAANANGQTAGGADNARDPGDKSGASAGLPVVVGASGNASSATRSAISGGNVVIRDEVAQQDLTGLTATQTIAALNRDTSSDTLNALKPIFDKEKIEAGFEIASEAQKQVGQFLETRAREAKALEDALKNEPEGPRRDQGQHLRVRLLQAFGVGPRRPRPDERRLPIRQRTGGPEGGRRRLPVGYRAKHDLGRRGDIQSNAALNRDTSSDTLNALKPIFDEKKIEAGFEIASEAQKQVGQFLEAQARQAKALEDALKNEPEGPRRDQLKQAFEDAKTDDVRLFVP
ncbi:hemagglutinin repeat-containing protein [Achromobacter sp. CF-sbj1-Ac2-l]|uniref:Uncharacterized protein n=2 Tax=Achromobacter dolens TaxID=1287738 RepID=A0A6S7CPT1_9BURK|nr:hypothetical protein LMG26841_02268 [Achromobacter dolens]